MCGRDRLHSPSLDGTRGPSGCPLKADGVRPMTTMTARRQLRPVGWRLLIATAMTAGTIAAATASSMTTGVAAAANVRPNVLNIVLDDMRDQTPAQIKKYMPKT